MSIGPKKDVKDMTIEELLNEQAKIARLIKVRDRVDRMNILLIEARRRDQHNATVGDVETHEFAAEVSLEALYPGLIFVTRDGILAVKSEYYYPNGNCKCILLESGEYAHFPQGNATMVRPLYLKQLPEPDGAEEAEACLA